MKRTTLLSLNSILPVTGRQTNAIKIAVLAMLFCFTGFKGYSTVTVTPASGGTNICSTVATSPTTLGSITIAEGSTNDFPTGASSITLAPPPGWQFVVVSPSVFASGGDVSIGATIISATAYTINFSASGTTNLDVVTIVGLQVQATSSVSPAGNIFASSNFGVVGITTGASGTNFGSLSIFTALVPAVTISAAPSANICAGSSITFTPTPVNGGPSPTYNWFVNGSFVGTSGFFSTSTLSSGNTVNAIMTATGSCTSPTTATSNTITVTVNPIPNPVVVSGGGTFCGSTIITAANGGSGTIYFQGTTSGGTSTATPSSSQLISSSGTYYFRAQGPGGCWGNEGSTTVTISPAATANAGAGQSVCAGSSITLAGSIGGSATSSTWSAGSGTFSDATSLTSTYTPTIGSGTVVLTLTTNDPDAGGPCTVATSTMTVTVNALPNPVIVSGAGTFCNSTVLTAANGGSGTIFFQGTTSGGTSTVLGGTPQTITTTGTYFFRARSGASCWGTEGSAAVTINAPATANAGPGQVMCAGTTITLAGSIGGTATSSTWSAPSGSFSSPSSLTSTYTPTIGTGTVVLTLSTNDPDGIGPCPVVTSNMTVTVNPMPGTPITFGGGTFCNSATINSFLIGPGTVFFQGTTSGGTFTTLGGSPQTVTSSGTYFFRAQSAAGCWGPESSATVTINPLPTAYNVLGGGSYCLGGTGVTVGLSSSDAGVNYQLFRGATPLATLPGTGAPLDYGLQTTAGTYTVVATIVATGCQRTMTGSASVSINTLPTAFTVTGTGSYCAGGTGVNVNLSGSAVGVNYELRRGGIPTGTTLAGTGAGFTFGPQTVAGVYTVVATNTITGCTNNMLSSATISINPLPTAFSVTGGGGYCTGGTGLSVGLGGSTVGVNYQLLIDAVPSGAPVAGTGSAITFGLQTVGGTYTVVATNTTTLCTNNMTGSVVITVNPLPGTYTVTGGGNFCSGGVGVSVGLSGSDMGINYQLFNGASPVGTPLAGTGSSLDFGLQTVGGTYTVVATDATTACTSTMTGSATITVDPLPTAYTVGGGGSYCSGGAGVNVSLLGSDLGVDYQLFNLFSPVGAPVPGTGGILSFGLHTAAGFYTVVATNTVTLCTNNMAGGVAIAIIPLPAAYNVTGGGPYCTGGAGANVGLDGSDLGTNYQLFQGITPVGFPVAGTGAALDFGPQTVAGTYTVVATDATTGCVNIMNGSTVVSIAPLPLIYIVSGGGAYCAGGTGVSIGLTGSDAGVNYQLFDGGTPVGAPVAGTGSAISFGLITGAGTYTVVATDGLGCTSNMTGSATVNITPLPTAYSVTGGGSYCAGGTGLSVGLSSSDMGVDYQLFLDGSPVGSAIPGSGSTLDFGLQIMPGTYTVSAMDMTTSCLNAMTGSAIIVVDPLPTSHVVTGGGSYCAGGTGVNVSLSGSESGVNYQLMVGVTPTGTPIPGTGSSISFGLQTAAGIYTVVATNAATGCTNTMASSATVVVDPAPNAYSIAGGGTYCVGGVGFDITLSGSDAGISYQLYNGPTLVGPAMPGTGSMLDFGFQTLAGTYTIEATNTSTGCTATMTGTSVIVVSTYPVVAAISGASTVCQGASTLFTDATPAGVWASSNASIATVSVSGSVTGVAAGSADISYTVTNPGGCATTVSVSVTVLSAPTVAAISGPSNVCQGLSIGLTDATPGGVWSSSNTMVASVSLSGVVTGVTVGSATISYTVTSGTTGCSTSVIRPITVGNPMPMAAMLPVGSATLCDGLPVNMSVVTSGGSGLTYQWYVGGIPITGAVSSTYSVTTPGVYSAVLSNGTCQIIFPGTNVVAPPMPVISYDTLAGLLFTGAFVTYQWYLNGVAIPGATNNNIIPGPLGSIHTVVVSDANGCTDTSAIFVVGGITLNTKTVLSGSDVRIYPNPVSSVLFIDAPEKVSVSVITTDGRVLVNHQEAVSLNVGQLADGMYMIMVYDQNGTLIKTDKFIKVQ